MSVFKDKVKQLKDKEISIYTPEYLQQIWTILIACGGATKLQEKPGLYDYNAFVDYYAARVGINTKLTENIYLDIVEYGVNWKACSDPAVLKGQGFNGTFTSTQLEVDSLVGKLVLNNGEEYYWGTDLQNQEFATLIKVLVRLELTFEQAIEELEERLTTTYFEYTCKFPEL